MNNRSIVRVAVILVIIAGIGGAAVYANQNNMNGNTNGAAKNTDSNMNDMNVDTKDAVETDMVAIKNFDYTPEKIIVKVGTTVTWTNEDSVGHTVTGDGDGKSFMNSKLLQKGESYSVTFDKSGEYPYFCQPHPYMKGAVIVTE